MSAMLSKYSLEAVNKVTASRNAETMMLESWVTRYGSTAIMGLICLLLLAGKILHTHIVSRYVTISTVYLPPALMGGLLGLLCYLIISMFDEALAMDIRVGMDSVRINLVNYVFAALMLGLTCTQANSSHTHTWRGVFTSVLHEGMPMMIYSQILIWGQSLACLLVIFVLKYIFGVGNSPHSYLSARIYGTLVPLGVEAGDDGFANTFMGGTTVCVDAEDLGLLVSMVFGIVLVSNEKYVTDVVNNLTSKLSYYNLSLGGGGGGGSSMGKGISPPRSGVTPQRAITPSSMQTDTNVSRHMHSSASTNDVLMTAGVSHTPSYFAHSEGFQRRDSNSQKLGLLGSSSSALSVTPPNAITSSSSSSSYSTAFMPFPGSPGVMQRTNSFSSLYNSRSMASASVAAASLSSASVNNAYFGDKSARTDKASLGAHLSFIAVSAFVSFVIVFVARCIELHTTYHAIFQDVQLFSGVRLFKLSMFCGFVCMHVVLWRSKIRFERDWFMRICGLLLDMVCICAIAAAVITFNSHSSNASASASSVQSQSSQSSFMSRLFSFAAGAAGEGDALSAHTQTANPQPVTTASSTGIDGNYQLWYTFLFVGVCLAWNVVCLLLLAKHMFPNFWLKRGIVLSCDAMGHAYTGLLFARMLDPAMCSPVPAAYAYKLMLFFIPSSHTKVTILSKLLGKFEHKHTGTPNTDTEESVQGLILAILVCVCVLACWYTIYEGQFRSRYVIDHSNHGRTQQQLSKDSNDSYDGRNNNNSNNNNNNNTKSSTDVDDDNTNNVIVSSKNNSNSNVRDLMSVDVCVGGDEQLSNLSNLSNHALHALKFDTGSVDVYDDYGLGVGVHSGSNSVGKHKRSNSSGSNNNNYMDGGAGGGGAGRFDSSVGVTPRSQTHTPNKPTSSSSTPVTPRPPAIVALGVGGIEFDEGHTEPSKAQSQSPPRSTHTTPSNKSDKSNNNNNNSSSSKNDIAMQLFLQQYGNVLSTSDILSCPSSSSSSSSSSNNSNIMNPTGSPHLLQHLISWLPTERTDRAWRLRYSLLKDGASLHTLMSQCGVLLPFMCADNDLMNKQSTHQHNLHHSQLRKQAKALNSYVIVIEDSWGYKFGGYIGNALEHNAVRQWIVCCLWVCICAEENKQDEASRTDSVHWNSEVDRSVQTKNVGYYYFSIVENLLF
jgi:hypothetical protein